MTGNTLNAFLFLIQTLFDFYAIILIIRLILAWVHADFYNPITQFVIRATDFLVRPLKKILPHIRGFELATFALIFFVAFIKFFIITTVSFGFPNPLGILILAFSGSIRLILQIMTIAIFLQAIISWINPASPVSHILNQFVSPVLKPFRKLIPPISGIDISPIPAIILLQIIIIVIINPIESYGLGVAVGA